MRHRRQCAGWLMLAAHNACAGAGGVVRTAGSTFARLGRYSTGAQAIRPPPELDLRREAQWATRRPNESGKGKCWMCQRQEGAGSRNDAAACSRICSQLADEGQALLAAVPAPVVVGAVLKRKKKALKSEDGKAGPSARRCQRD